MKPKVRDRVLAAGAVSVALALTGISVAGLADDRVVPTPAVHDAILHTRVPGEVRLQFLGDTMLGDGSQPLIDEQGPGVVSERLGDFVDGDYTVANLEGVVTDGLFPVRPGKSYNYRADPRTLEALRTMGVDAVGLGNNHSMDYGPDGLADTRAAAQAAAVTAFGAGSDIADSRRPLLLDTPGGKVALVSFTEDFGSTSSAGSSRAGTVVFDSGEVQHGLDSARAAGADVVIAVVHWGDNYLPINASQKQWAATLAQAGYDAVVGSGPHISQPVTMADQVPIINSVGNFVFGAPGRFESFGLPGFGLSATAVISGGELKAFEFRCLKTDNERVHFRPKPCSLRTSHLALDPLSPGLTWSGTTATLTLPGP